MTIDYHKADIHMMIPHDVTSVTCIQFIFIANNLYKKNRKAYNRPYRSPEYYRSPAIVMQSQSVFSHYLRKNVRNTLQRPS